VLRGRRSECQTLDTLLDAVRAGESRVLVVRGEAGVGKTALLDYMMEQATGCHVARAAAVGSEMELPFAGLHQLCAPMLDRLDRLPAGQREALATAFGLRPGDAPDRVLIGLAVLSVVSEVAEERPLVCLIDDAQWLDEASASALAFLARRLMAESVALVFAVREPSAEQDLAGLPELVVEGLADNDARALLDSALGGPLDERVRDQIVAETRGNPLALLELPRGLTTAELAGGFGLPAARALSTQIEESFRRRLEPLGAETRQLLLVAAAEPIGEPELLWRAARRLGVGPEAAAPAAEAGLLEPGAPVRFRHPLVRSAVYRAASQEERQQVHAALAEATDPEADPDRRAWHRAQATPEPDERVAAELERSAGRAQGRGGVAAAAAFLERATELTSEPAQRARRALAAAEAKYQAGAPDAALGLLATADAGPLDPLRRARVDLLRARIAFASSPGSDTPQMLLQAARQLEPLDLELARETYLEALSAAIFAGRLAGTVGLEEVAEAARAAGRAGSSPQAGRAVDLLLDGQVLLITEGYTAAAPTLKRALSAFRAEDLSREEGLRWLSLACRTAADLWDDDSWEVLSARHVQLARDAGALTMLPPALTARAGIHVFAGDLATAEELGEEARGVGDAIGDPGAPYTRLLVAVWRGRREETAALMAAAGRDAAARGEGRAIGFGQYATAVLFNALGRYDDALAMAQQASRHAEEQGSFSSWGIVELIEAATRSRKSGVAAGAFERLAETTQASGTGWALGIEARSRALLTDGPGAEPLYREAIDRLGRTRVRMELARAHLLYGEWLRRERRRLDAREQLHTAHEMLTEMGLEAFAQRAARELQAAGETARRRTVETSGDLTAQEAQVARLARDGLSNPEIGSQLFISRRTVEYHLRKVFMKLDITSRDQLDGVLSDTLHQPSGAARHKPAS
jgi:DNA-binding CsgD family transcriptional regulator